MTNPEAPADWLRMQFKKNKVWVAIDDEGCPLVNNGKVLIKYQLDQPHEYWVHRTAVVALGENAPNGSAPRAKRSGAVKTGPKPNPLWVAAGPVSPEECARSICIYTDGACSGNPGPAGIGAVLHYKGNTKEISRHIGMATNNIAELEAIKTALLAVKNRNLPVIVFTDSNYALGLLTRGWKARENQALVAELRQLVGTFSHLKIVKVKGHAGHAGNERADQLAVGALKAVR